MKASSITARRPLLTLIGVMALAMVDLAGCASQTPEASTAKDVQVFDNDGNIVDFSLLKGSLFAEDGYVVWDGTASQDGQTAQVVNRKMLRSDLLQHLHSDLDATPYGSAIGTFMSEVSNDQQSFVIDVAQQTVKLPNGTMLSGQQSLSQVAISAVKTIASAGDLDATN